MKTNPIPALLLFLLAAAGAGCDDNSAQKPAAPAAPAASASAAAASDAAAKETAAIRASIQKMVIPNLHFRDTPLNRAVSVLADLASVYGSDLIKFAPLPKGINGDVTVTMEVGGMSLEQILDNLARNTGTQWCINNGAIEFLPLAAAAAPS